MDTPHACVHQRKFLRVRALAPAFWRAWSILGIPPSDVFGCSTVDTLPPSLKWHPRLGPNYLELELPQLCST